MRGDGASLAAQVPPPRIWIGIPKWSFAQFQAARRLSESGRASRNAVTARRAASRSSVLRASTWTRCTSYGSAAASRPWNPAGSSAGSMPGGSATTFTSNPWRSASSIPRRVAASPAASPSNASQSRLVRRPSSFSCASVSAVPMHATTGSNAGLAERDDVGVALDDARPVLAARSRGGRGRARRRLRPCEELGFGSVRRTSPGAGSSSWSRRA